MRVNICLINLSISDEAQQKDEILENLITFKKVIAVNLILEHVKLYKNYFRKLQLETNHETGKQNLRIFFKHYTNFKHLPRPQ